LFALNGVGVNQGTQWMDYPISELAKEDYRQAVNLACLCFGEDMRDVAEGDFSATFADYPFRPKTFVAKHQDNVIGIIQSITAYIASDAQAFAWVGVHPDFRKRHIGRALLAYAENETILRRFRDTPGTFLLVASYDPNYYRSQGYQGGDVTTHNGQPFLVKHYAPRANR
jgi:ribosomal protein S18 acetylase RimI-like enzyme